MIDKIRRLLAIQDEDGKFILDADVVAKIVGKHRNSIYESRKGDCKLDKLAIFDKIKEIVESETLNETVITGDKNGILKGVNGMLKDDVRYIIAVKEV